MFAGDVSPPKCKKRPKPNPMKYDIQLPGLSPGHYQHIAREPNSNYFVQNLQYIQNKNSYEGFMKKNDQLKHQNDQTTIKYNKHFERKHLQKLIKDRVQQKIDEYEATIEQRRERLKDLLCKEEREFYYETVELAQKGGERKMEEMKNRAEILRARREEARQQIVHEKRIEQYRNRCELLRPTIIKKHLIETKNAQLQQMRENEARRAADKEMEMMWQHVTTKKMQAQMEREEQEAIAKKNTQRDLLDVWEKQLKGKELLKQEEEKIDQENRIEMIKLAEQIRREEIAELDEKRRKRDKNTRELMEQLAVQEKLLAKRKADEQALDQAFAHLTQLEVEKELQKLKDTTTQARRETAMYRKHLQELEEERKKEEKELWDLLEYHRKEVEKKQDEAKCKVVEAKRALQRDVLKGRAEQLEHKRQLAEQQLELKRAENELLRMAFDTNERLEAEAERLAAESARQYGEDLKKQIEYNKLLRERERQDLERQLKEGMKLEETYMKVVEDMVKHQLEGGIKHPFRRVLERYDCHCPPPTN